VGALWPASHGRRSRRGFVPRAATNVRNSIACAAPPPPQAQAQREAVAKANGLGRDHRR
jgi:hypothetical protein